MCSEHAHDHQHTHSHGKMPVYLYFVGLALAIIAFIIPFNETVQNILYVLSILSAGYHVIVEGVEDTIHKTMEHRKLMPNAHLLMALAALGSCIMGDYFEGALLILIFAGAHFLEDYAEGRSKREITKLMQMHPTTARLIVEGGTQEVEVDALKIGDKVQVLNGDQVPIDGVIISGATSIDESAINGESMPKEKVPGDKVFGSTINGTGTFVMEVTKENKDTVFSKILQLVNENQNNQTRAAGIIQKYEPVYVTCVIIAVVLVILMAPLLLGWDFNDSMNKGLILLVAASPCALAAATVSATLSATSNLARRGLISKGSAYLSQLADIKAIAFDKTGTLTRGVPEVTDDFFEETIDRNEVTNIIVALEKDSNHPLAGAVLRHYQPTETLNIEVTNDIGQGIRGQFNNKKYSIEKPTAFNNVTPHIQMKNDTWAAQGKTVVYVAEDNQVIGAIAMMDVPAEAAADAIAYFKSQNIHTTLITGDSVKTGEAVAKQLQIDEVIANVMPEDKSRLIAEQQAKFGKVAMIGDGVNDAPALVKADVGIAMGEGTDVAIEVSDLVLMKNNLQKLTEAHQISKKMNRIIWENIIFALLVVVFLVVMSFTGLANITASVIMHEGSTLVVILNGLRMLRGIK